jgi:TatD DNase family protein
LASVIDTHCHLDACEQPVPDLVARARATGVDRILAIGMNAQSCRHALAAAGDHEEVFVSVGRHPHEAADFDSADLEEIHHLAQDQNVRAIGETGLDYHRDYCPRDDQARAFVAQMKLAADLHLPLIVHTRDAEDDTFELLEQHAIGIPIVLHCFSLADRVDDCIELGYYCSFAGNVTYPNARELQTAARQVPNELLLVETDAPFLAPQQHRGKHNEPAFVRATASFLAELRDQPYDELEGVVQKNAEWMFRW